ncbi:sensor histidine kinase [Paenibacillus hamazuiensis]|uniref:sensor histidine kinase n=1 Tax=Paenibacillus hamazuiensis TaxID=2936508 RepID=UPI00201004B0|nr:histidine kinase [Paenibacillus hamazuiensis]
MLPSKMTNIKWKVLISFGAVTLLVMGGFIAAIRILSEGLQAPVIQITVLAGLLLLGLTVGFFRGRSIQRGLDTLHLSIIELSKGNWTRRILSDPSDPFHRIYQDFNEMAEAVENKVQLLQKTAEKHASETQTIERAVTEERKRLARDLHDTVSQQLFAIHMSAASLPKLLEQKPEAAQPIMEQLTQMSHHAQKQIRGLIAQLRPIELEGVSLKEGLDKWFPDYCRQNGLQGRLELQCLEGLSEAIEHQLFLIVQEGMANVVKHASAQSVILSLFDAGHQVMLQIRDDGQGFSRDDVTGQSYGLTTMRERAQKLGGDMEVTSKPGAGTTIKVKIPKFKEEPKVVKNDDGND